jgi:hypothetical protein
MSRQLVRIAAILGSLLSLAGVARAQDAQDRSPFVADSKLLFMPGDTAALAVMPVLDETPIALEAGTPAVFEGKRTSKMLPLYVSTALMQALDVHSTLQVIGHGGAEGNPLLQGIVSNKGAFIAAKAAVAASTMYAASRIARHSKIGAIITLVGLNSAYAMVVSHNYKLAHQLR